MGNARTQLRTLSVGGAAYDIFVNVDPTVRDYEGQKHMSFPVGSKVHVQNIIETCGGGAANTATGLARLGCNACFCGIVAEDQWGKRMIETLKAEKVDVRCATIVENETTGFSIILLLPNGERTILNHPGSNKHLDAVTFDLEALKNIDGVYVNRLNESACTIEDNIVGVFVQSPDTHLTWNPGGCQLEHGMNESDKKALLAVTNLLLLNKEEALLFTKKNDMKDALKALRDAGAKNICISDGKEGSFGTDGKKFYHVPARTDVTVVDATGAGDAFGCAATWALLHEEILPTAMKAGTLNAASVIRSIGAQAGLLTDTEIHEQLRNHPLAVEELSW